MKRAYISESTSLHEHHTYKYSDMEIKDSSIILVYPNLLLGKSSILQSSTLREFELDEIPTSDSSLCNQFIRYEDNLSSINEITETTVNRIVEEILPLMRNDLFIYGEESNTEKYIVYKGYGPFLTTKALLRIYQKYTNIRQLTVGAAHIISNLDEPTDEAAAIAALAVQRSETILVKYGLIAFGSWNSKTYLELIKSLSCREAWLDNYRHIVISKLEKIDV